MRLMMAGVAFGCTFDAKADAFPAGSLVSHFISLPTPPPNMQDIFITSTQGFSVNHPLPDYEGYPREKTDQEGFG